MDRTTLKLNSADLRRDITFTREAVDAEKRSLTISFSSEIPVERWYGYEILDHSGTACDLSRLNNRAPLLLNHDTDNQIGVVERAWMQDGKGYAEVRFGKSAGAEECFKDVTDGIRSKVSVGYRVRSMIHDSTQDGVDTYRVTGWQPYEISIVSVPADDSVGVGRAQETPTEITVQMKRNLHLNPSAEGGGGAAPAAPAAPKVEVVENAARTSERTRISEINTLARKFKVPDAEVDKFISDGSTVDAFRAHILETRGAAKPVATEDPSIGMSAGEVKRWSLVRAISRIAAGKPLDGIEKEASDAVAQRNRREPGGFFVPHDIAGRSLAETRGLSESQVRALNVTTSTQGGFTVGTDVLGSSLISLLRNKAMVAQLGASSLSGLMGDVAIPKVTGGATAYWLSETETGSDSTQAFGQLGLKPKRLFGATAFTKQLLAQSSIDVEGFVRDDLMRVLALEKDRVALNGLGADGEPLGILNTTGINTVTFSAAATWAKVVQFETEVATDNADYGTMAYLTTAPVRGKWKTTPKVTAQALYLWESSNTVNGYRAEVSQQVPSDKVIFGNWANVIMADWDGMDVVVDPFSLAGSGQVKVTIQLLTDVGVRHPASFCVSTDSGAQ